MSQDAFSTEDGRGSSEATPDSYTWMFQTSPYGFSITPAEDGYMAGTTATATILMDGSDAGYATIENVDTSMVSFDQNEFWGDRQSDRFLPRKWRDDLPGGIL